MRERLRGPGSLMKEVRARRLRGEYGEMTVVDSILKERGLCNASMELNFDFGERSGGIIS